MLAVAEQRRVIEREETTRHDLLALARNGMAEPVQGTAGRLLPREKRAGRASTSRATEGRG